MYCYVLRLFRYFRIFRLNFSGSSRGYRGSCGGFVGRSHSATQKSQSHTATPRNPETGHEATRSREQGREGGGGGILLHASLTVAVVADEDSRLLQVSLRACGKGVALSSLRMYWYLMLTD